MRTEANWIINADRALPLDPKLTPSIIRAIQIDALREARELVEKHTIWAADHETEEPVSIPNPALPELDRLIRERELS